MTDLCLQAISFYLLLLVSEVEAQGGNNDDHSKEKNLQGKSWIMAFWKLSPSVIVEKLIFVLSHILAPGVNLPCQQ